MYESALAYFAWIIVVAFQAFIHYRILGGRKRCSVARHVHPIEHPCTLTGTISSILCIVTNATYSVDAEDESSLNGGEQQAFQDLLDQTGYELSRSSTSLENLIRDQIMRIDEALPGERAVPSS